MPEPAEVPDGVPTKTAIVMAVYVLLNLVIDILYGVIDPRVRV